MASRSGSADVVRLLLREVEQRTDIVAPLAACFSDHREPERIQYTVPELVAQRAYAERTVRPFVYGRNA